MNILKNRFFYFVISFIFLSGCGSNLKDYDNSQPNFELKEFFNGSLTAYGAIQDNKGKVIRRFKADLEGEWQGNQGILDEVFYFDDGEEQKRIWRLKKEADGSYSGTADDVVGVANGKNKGFAFNWKYVLKVQVDGSEWEINLDDWLYLLDEDRLINKTKMSKLGINVGEITIYIEKNNKFKF